MTRHGAAQILGHFIQQIRHLFLSDSRRFRFARSRDSGGIRIGRGRLCRIRAALCYSRFIYGRVRADDKRL